MAENLLVGQTFSDIPDGLSVLKTEETLPIQEGKDKKGIFFKLLKNSDDSTKLLTDINDNTKKLLDTSSIRNPDGTQASQKDIDEVIADLEKKFLLNNKNKDAGTPVDDKKDKGGGIDKGEIVPKKPIGKKGGAGKDPWDDDFSFSDKTSGIIDKQREKYTTEFETFLEGMTAREKKFYREKFQEELANTEKSEKQRQKKLGKFKEGVGEFFSNNADTLTDTADMMLGHLSVLRKAGAWGLRTFGVIGKNKKDRDSDADVEANKGINFNKKVYGKALTQTLGSDKKFGKVSRKDLQNQLEDKRPKPKLLPFSKKDTPETATEKSGANMVNNLLGSKGKSKQVKQEILEEKQTLKATGNTYIKPRKQELLSKGGVVGVSAVYLANAFGKSIKDQEAGEGKNGGGFLKNLAGYLGITKGGQILKNLLGKGKNVVSGALKAGGGVVSKAGGVVSKVAKFGGKIVAPVGAALQTVQDIKDANSDPTMTLGQKATTYAIGKKQDTVGGSAMNALGQATKWGIVGSTIGSIIPGLGTALGGAIGATLGAGTAIGRDLFTGRKKPEDIKEGEVIQDNSFTAPSAIANSYRATQQSPLSKKEEKTTNENINKLASMNYDLMEMMKMYLKDKGKKMPDIVLAPTTNVQVNEDRM